MNCAEVSQKIELFILGEMPEPEQVAIETHLAACPTCKAAEVHYRLLITHIKQVSQPDALRLDFVRSVHSATKAEIRRIAHRSLMRRIIAITASVAACFVFGSVAWHAWFSEPGPLHPFPGQTRGTRQSRDAHALEAPSVLKVWQHRGALSAPGSMADEVVICGQDMYLLQQSGRQAHVVALDIKTGRQNWLSDIQACGHIVADDSRLYCLSPNGPGALDLVALDAADGKVIWRCPQPFAEPLRSPSRPILLPTGHICWTTNTTVQMLSCTEGKLVWTHSISDGGLLSAPIFVDNDIYVASTSGLYCLSIATGEESWRLAYSGIRSGRDRPLLAAADGEIYASLSLGLSSSRLICIDRVAHKIPWSKDLAHVTYLCAIGDMLYLRDQNVQALDKATGRLLWTIPAAGCNPVTYEGSLAYFVDSRDHGGLVAVDRYTGRKVWELAGMKSCNAFVKIDRTGYVKTLDGVVHAIVFKG